MREHYLQILGLDTSANENDIKKAFRKLALIYHPDINKSANSVEKFNQILEAYEKLTSSLEEEPKDQNTYTSAYKRDPNYRPSNKTRYKKRQKTAAEIEHEIYNKKLLELMQLAAYTIIGIFMIGVPILISFHHGARVLLYTLIIWVIGIFLLLESYSKRHEIKLLVQFFLNKYKEKKEQHTYKEITNCYFSKNTIADRLPYEANFVKILDITLKNRGVLQHQVQYKRNYKSVYLPYSNKAFRVHIIANAIKVLSIFICLIFVPGNSYVFKFFLGAFIGGLLAITILKLNQTRSRYTHLLNYSIVLKIAYLLFFGLISTQFVNGFGFYTESSFEAGFIAILILDSFVESLLKLFPNNLFFKPIIKQHRDIQHLLDDGYQNNISTPLWTIIYPLFKWLIW